MKINLSFIPNGFYLVFGFVKTAINKFLVLSKMYLVNIYESYTLIEFSM